MSNFSRYQFGDIVDCEINPKNPDLNNRTGYLLFVKGEADGFYAIKGYKMRNMSNEQKESLRNLGLLLGEDNSDLHVDTFFDYNYMIKYPYDVINAYRWTLTDQLKNNAIQGITKSYNDRMYPEDFKINSFLETIKYNPESLNGDEKSLLMVNKINNNVVPSSTGISRTRLNIIKK